MTILSYFYTHLFPIFILMLFSARIALIFIAIALIGWGIMHFLVGEFIAGRAPSWPEAIPGKIAWAYASGILLFGSSLFIVFPNQDARWANVGSRVVTCTGLIILAWAGGRNLWLVLPNLDYGGNMTNLGKSITIGSALLMIANNKSRSLFTFACVCIGLFFFAGGIQHFIFIDFVKTLVPRWIPGDVFWSYVAGAGLVAAGVALITGVQRRLAALIMAWVVFIWFLILHIPRGFGETASFNEWIAICEALFVSATLAIIYWWSGKGE